MKKILLIILLIILTGCSNSNIPSQTNKKAFDDVIFTPTIGDYMVDEFEDVFLESSHNYDSLIIEDIKSCISKEIVDEYGINAFMVTTEDSYIYYLYYNNQIFRASGINANKNNINKGFVHFAITDFNNDGFIELLSSFYISGNIRISYLAALDTKSVNVVTGNGLYHGKIYFKKYNNKVAAFLSNDTLENANELYTEFIVNDYKYEFLQNDLYLKSESYNVNVSFEKDTIDFPIMFKGISLSFKATTKMVWLKEAFTYVNPDIYMDGAIVTFICGDSVIGHDGFGAGCVALPDKGRGAGRIAQSIPPERPYFGIFADRSGAKTAWTDAGQGGRSVAAVPSGK